MKNAWNAAVLVAAVCNGIGDIARWYTEAPATGIVWLFSILFSVRVAMDSLEYFFPSLSSGVRALGDKS